MWISGSLTVDVCVLLCHGFIAWGTKEAVFTGNRTGFISHVKPGNDDEVLRVLSCLLREHAGWESAD